MSSGKVKCTCGWSWNKSDSSKKDMYICHECGRDNSNNMKNGGWLDSYADGGTMQEYQENYNDNSVFLPEGFVGEGYNTKGRDYSPAWGGQFQSGGKLTFLQPTSDKLPQGYRIPYADPSSELAMSIGGEDGEPAYLIPSFKYGRPLENPIEEFKKTGEHLGGPFKTWQEADQWEQEVRHPYVEKGQAIPMPIKTWGEMAMGGSIPGSVGFTYARTQSPAPSNGPYAKKTKASAQNGETLQYGTPEYKKAYDENRVAYYDKDSDTYINQELAPIEVQGRVRDKGFWEQYVDKIVNENRGASPLEAAIGVPISAVSSLPQLAATYAFTDKVQRPSEAMDIENPYLAMGTDFVLDPLNATGTGILTKEQALARLAASKESGLLSNVNKLNPFAKTAESFNNPNSFYRQIDNITYREGVKSGLIKGKQDIGFRGPESGSFNLNKSFGDDAYYNKGSLYSPQRADYIYEVKKGEEAFIPKVNNRTRGYTTENTSVRVSKEPIPLEEATIYKKDWLQGYKPIQIPKQNNAQSSFIKQDLSEGNNIKYSFTDKQGNNIGTFSGRKNPEGIYVNSIEINPELRRQGLASKIYKDIAKDLQSKNEGTLFSRSTQHQFTDKDKLGRSVAPANKLWENLVNKGEAEKFVEGMSHTYKIKPLKEGGVIKDDLGQWAHPGEITEIGSNQITMQGVPYPVLGISDEGDVQMMYPEEEYEFVGKKVTEFPMAKNGLRQEQKGLVNLDQLTNFTNYNTKQPGGWLDNY